MKNLNPQKQYKKIVSLRSKAYSIDLKVCNQISREIKKFLINKQWNDAINYVNQRLKNYDTVGKLMLINTILEKQSRKK